VLSRLKMLARYYGVELQAATVASDLRHLHHLAL
jgi:hypothetical protein